MKFCRPKNHKICQVIFKNCKQPFSADYHYGNYEKPFIIIRIGNHTWFPLKFNLRRDRIKRSGYFGSYNYRDRYEALISITSHEFFHDFCHSNPKLKHLLYQDLPRAEKLADLYALKKLEKFRELKKAGINIFKNET